MMNGATVYLALGSNLGNRRVNLREATHHLWQHVVVERLSSIYETAPAYVTDQPRFLNMVLRGTTTLSPRELLHLAKSIEQQMGRTTIQRYGPRLIDIDILAYDNVQLHEPDLTIPHPLISERAFVLAPLAEIAPDLVLPGQAKTVQILAQQFGTEGEVLSIVGGFGM